MKLIVKWLFTALAVLVAARFVPGIGVASLGTALLVALILGLVNAIIRPIIVLFTLPVTILTLGLFILIINGVLFWLVASLVSGFEVAGFVPAFWGALIVSVVSFIGNRFLHAVERNDE
ncbi:MAG TPA: phage holin family protein [Candidatus Paceibacterota bacterium]|nr:phage holin family protein [Candidatus Paceibacterota bacterium]